MFCTNCGTRLNEQDRFCVNCGSKVGSYTSPLPSDNSNQAHFVPTVNYSMYEVFDSSSSISSKIHKMTDKLLAKMNANTVTVSNFIITDRSIIFDNNEYLFEQMSVLFPSGDLSPDIFGGEYLYGYISTYINGVQYIFNYSKEKRLSFFRAVTKANDNIELKSKKQMLQYIRMLYCLILNLYSAIYKLPIEFDENDKFDELIAYNRKVKINPDTQISDVDKELITEYTLALEKANEFYKKTNAIPNKGYNRRPDILSKIVEFMTDSDTDTEEAIRKYNQKLLEDQLYEEQRRQEELERQQNGYYDQPQGGGFISGVLKTAAGVAIGNSVSNKLGTKSNKQSSGKTSYSSEARYCCRTGCKFQYSECGMPRCRISNEWSNRPAPEKCGYGLRYR